jgi:hypothetical protein
MEFRDKTIKPPKSWKTFEEMCHALFKKVWNDPLAQLNGRTGQAQHGVDVFGSPNGDRALFHGVQCKGKDQNYGGIPTLTEIKKEVAKAENFSPNLMHWIFATTAPSDAKLQRAARELSIERKKSGKFSIDILGWEEIIALLASEPSVRTQFYPEEDFNIPEILKKLDALPDNKNSSFPSEVQNGQSTWENVTFDHGRGLGPALMGRALGPADAVACPRLSEADILVSQLKLGFCARMEGLPGSGKSVCTYQAALTFSHQGISVVRLRDPSEKIPLKFLEINEPTLYIIDDAHLINPHILKILEDNTSANRLLLSTHTTVDSKGGMRGAIALDTKRAVKTISSALISNRESTLISVQSADKDIGDRMMETRLEDRIDDAERGASFPWQFCFILGGGWRRAQQAADNARSAQADIVLSIIALRQLASRDSRASSQDIIDIIGRDVDPLLIHQAIKWLVEHRLILSLEDCRCPHQRFSAVVLHYILAGQNKANREFIFRMCEKIICDESYPLVGIRNVLHELRPSPINYSWRRSLQSESLDNLAQRCWKTTGEERLFAALVLDEISNFRESWIEYIVIPNQEILTAWISNPEKCGSGFFYLLNTIYNIDKGVARLVVSKSDAKFLAELFSNATPENCYGLSELSRIVGYSASQEWVTKFSTSIDQGKLINIANIWGPDKIWHFTKICTTVAFYDLNLALKMIEASIPTIHAELTINVIDTFRDLDDVASRILNISDPLGIYVGKFRPSKQKKDLARKICIGINPMLVAQQISSVKKRDFQAAAYFLNFFLKCTPKKFNTLVSNLDWEKLSQEIGNDWKDLTHEAEILIGILSSSPNSRGYVVKFIADHINFIKRFPLRLAIIAPQVALDYASSKGDFQLVKHGHVDWTFGPFFIELLGRENPEILQEAFNNYKNDIAKVLSAHHQSFYSDSAIFLQKLRFYALSTLESILELIDVKNAEIGWTNCLTNSGSQQHAIAILVDVAINMPGEIGLLANRMRKRFPKSTIPKSK